MMKKMKGLLALLALLVSVCAPALAETQQVGPLKDSAGNVVGYNGYNTTYDAYEYVLNDGSYTLGDSDRGVRIGVNGDVTVTLDKANITGETPVHFILWGNAQNARATLVLKGESTLTSTNDVALHSEIPLTIKEDDSTGGSLKLVADGKNSGYAYFNSDLTLKTKNVTFDSSGGDGGLTVVGRLICEGDFIMGGRENENEPWVEFSGAAKFARIFEGKTLPKRPDVAAMPQTGDPSMLGAWVCLLGASAAGIKLRKRR